MSLNSQHLTPHPDRHVANTAPGQASWADPSIGKTCRECAFWRRIKGRQERACLKVWEMTKKRSIPLSGSAIACRYFEQGKKPDAPAY